MNQTDPLADTAIESPHLPEEARRCIFWGKYLPEGPRCLPLVAHCMDVALVFRSLCELDGIKRSLQSSTSTTLTGATLDRLAVLAMLHDIGKANMGFQLKVFRELRAQAGHIRELAPLLDPATPDEDLRSAFINALPAGIDHWFPDDQVAYSYFLAIFSHHGRPLRFKGEHQGTLVPLWRRWWRRHGRWDPMAAVAEIGRWSRQMFPAAFEPCVPPLPAEPRFHHRFAGLLMLADWLASHPLWFPVEKVSLEERLRHSRQMAPKVLAMVGLDVRPMRPVLDSISGGFDSRFGFAPRPLQAAVDQLDPDDPRSRLVIAESETGSGKTEAALNWWFKLFRAGKVDGLYFALPTRVAAREIYGRIHRTICRWFPDPSLRPVTLLAVPGYAQVDGVPEARMLPSEDAANLWEDEDALRRQQRRWAGERPKRYLAATVAVGTIDQALLSIVQTSHAHLRSVCLDRSLLVVDEVHASDVYMSRLLEQLLSHHLSVGGYAMLLSATLGSEARYRYLKAAGASSSLPDSKSAESSPYPLVTVADGKSLCIPSYDNVQKEVRVELLPYAFRPEAVLDRLIAALRAGARVLVIMNTVDRAIALQRACESHPDIDPAWMFRCMNVNCPHHGRFAPEDRLVLDAGVSERWGPDSPPGPVLLIGTQTLEQSLDIDADLMVSDLAPADVLLQRIGRLHRHRRQRPAGFESPARLIVLVPPDSLAAALDERGNVKSHYRRLGYGSVYEDLRTLELTWKVLSESPIVSVPRDNRMLVERVTHPENLASLEGIAWKRHSDIIEGGRLARAIAANFAAASYTRYFGSEEAEFQEFGEQIAVRLDIDNLQLPLSQPIVSPFGQTIHELVIPRHLSPSHPPEEVVVEEMQHGLALLRCGDRRYRYHRFGLEEDL